MLPDQPRVVILRPTLDPLLYDVIDYTTRERLGRVQFVTFAWLAQLAFMGAVIGLVLSVVLWLVLRSHAV